MLSRGLLWNLTPALLFFLLHAVPAEAQSKRAARDSSGRVKHSRNLPEEGYFAAIGEGQTLPDKVVRLRTLYSLVTADSGFDSDGKRQDLGMTLRVHASAMVLEYGVGNRLTLQVLAPYYLRNELAIDADQFAKSTTYKEKVASFQAGVGTKLKAQGICPTEDACAQLINEGYALPADTAVTLPTGETLLLKAGVPIKSYAHALVIGAARPVAGRTGLGDVEFGALYSVFRRVNFGFSLGGGLRLPTGSFADVPAAERGTGRGTLDLGLRLNLDFRPVQGVWLSFQNQAEVMLRAAKRKRTSLLNSENLNEADPEADAAVAAGADGNPNDQKFERRGIRHVGFFKIGWGLGTITQKLAPLGVQAQYKYALQSEAFADGKSLGERESTQSLLGGLILDGLAYKWPIQLNWDVDRPIAGKNVALATATQTIQAKLYYRF